MEIYMASYEKVAAFKSTTRKRKTIFELMQKEDCSIGSSRFRNTGK